MSLSLFSALVSVLAPGSLSTSEDAAEAGVAAVAATNRADGALIHREEAGESEDAAQRVRPTLPARSTLLATSGKVTMARDSPDAVRKRRGPRRPRP